MSNKKIAVIFADSDYSAPFRYRCQNIYDIINTHSNKWQIKLYISNKDIEAAVASLRNASLLIIARQSGRHAKLKKLFSTARQYNVPIVFDIDDLIFHPKYARLAASTTLEKNFFYWFMYSFLVFRLCRKGDYFTTTNNFLREKLVQTFHKKTLIIPNFLNQQQISTMSQVKQKAERDHFTIGYFSGSPTHRKDFALVEPELIVFLQTHKNTKLRIVGYLKLSKKMKRLVHEKKVEFLKPVHYIKLQKLIAQVDINVAPLIENNFTNCKSELKFFEAAIVETPTIASPTYVFRNAIKNGKTGFLCCPGEWYECLEDLYNHPEKRQKVAKAAKKYCLENYYGDKIIKTIEDTYDFFAK